MSIRAKMIVNDVEDLLGSGLRIKLSCQYDDATPEDRRFQNVTPYGEASFNVNNESAIEQFTIGKEFYVDFTPIEASDEAGGEASDEAGGEAINEAGGEVGGEGTEGGEGD